MPRASVSSNHVLTLTHTCCVPPFSCACLCLVPSHSSPVNSMDYMLVTAPLHVLQQRAAVLRLRMPVNPLVVPVYVVPSIHVLCHYLGRRRCGCTLTCALLIGMPTV